MQQLVPWVSVEARAIFQRAFDYSEQILTRTRTHLDAQLFSRDLDPSKVCFAAAGSMGRREAMQASDLDLITIAEDEATYRRFIEEKLYDTLRGTLSEELGGIDVSTGRSIMGLVKLDDLRDPSKIGGRDDDRIALTRRTLVLTEAAQAGGGLELRSVRRSILEAYISRTDGAHPLAFCNDVARYYRQVCIDYKAKHAANETDWAESNVKLRHARKLWYFSTALAIASTAAKSRSMHYSLQEALLEVLDHPPFLRLLGAGSGGEVAAGEALTYYAAYLQRMADPLARERLQRIIHEHRYEDADYSALQKNSKDFHEAMLRLLMSMNSAIRSKIFDWFLL